jgi:hypothetical protein
MLCPLSAFMTRIGGKVSARSTLCAISAGAALFTGVAAASSPSSHADFVTANCRTAVHARSCGVALQYLAALDLDRAEDACRILDPGTLEAAGGLAACKRLLLQARGIRIHYRISVVAHSPLGTTLRFSTRADGREWLRQQMLVSPSGRIVAIMFEPW